VQVLGVLLAQWLLGRPAWYAIPQAMPWLRLGETIYREPTSPRPMTHAASACLATSQTAAAREAVARRVIAAAIVDAVGVGSRVRLVRALPGATPGYLRLPVRLADGLAGFEQPSAVIRLGLAPSYPSVLAAIPQVRPWTEDGAASWPGSEELVRTLVTLPTHSRLTGAERAELIRLLQAYERRT